MKFNLLAVIGVMLANWAQAAPVDLIVRYREPQNTLGSAQKMAFKTTEGKSRAVEILNSEEGVVKLSFQSLEEAQAAREKLAQSDAIVNIAPNLLYRPAINYRIKSISREFVPGRQFGFPFPFFGVGRSAVEGMPDVLIPSGKALRGPDPLFAQDWAMKAIRMELLQNTRATPRMTTAVIDTGVDYNHEDLMRAMWRKSGTPAEVGYDFAHNHAQPFDRVHFDLEGCLKDFGCRMGIGSEKYLVNPGHGTHCAGHVAAVANNTLGIRGIGAGAKVMALKFFFDAGEQHAGQGDDAGAIKAIDYAIKNGAKVISASWGGRVDRAEAEKSELKQALLRAQSAGVIVVIAAGNDGIDQENDETPSYPAAFELDNLIVVAATDRNDQLADFSNYGAKSVHLAAPGVKILSTTSGGRYSDEVIRFKDAQGKEHSLDWDGTSMATPIVAGAVALVWSRHPHLTYSEIRNRILQSARPAPALAGKVSTGGILDVTAALFKQ